MNGKRIEFIWKNSVLLSLPKHETLDAFRSFFSNVPDVVRMDQDGIESGFVRWLQADDREKSYVREYADIP